MRILRKCLQGLPGWYVHAITGPRWGCSHFVSFLVWCLVRCLGSLGAFGSWIWPMVFGSLRPKSVPRFDLCSANWLFEFDRLKSHSVFRPGWVNGDERQKNRVIFVVSAREGTIRCPADLITPFCPVYGALACYGIQPQSAALRHLKGKFGKRAWRQRKLRSKVPANTT